MHKNYSYLTDPEYLYLLNKRNISLRRLNNLRKIRNQKIKEIEFKIKDIENLNDIKSIDYHEDIENLDDIISVVNHEEILIRNDMKKIIKKYQNKEEPN